MIYICGVSLFGLVVVTFVAYACCVVAGRVDDIAEQRDGIRRS